MIHAAATREETLFLPQSVATNGTASGTSSSLGFDLAVIRLQLGTQTAANTDVLLRISEGDGTTFATSADFAMTTAAPNTSTGQLYRWVLDMRKRKKNLKIEYSPSASAARLAAATITYHRAEQAPASLTLKGLAGEVVV